MLCFKIWLKKHQFQGPQYGADLFLYTRKIVNFGSELSLPKSIIRTLVGNKITEHLISDIKFLFARYDIPAETKADNIS